MPSFLFGDWPYFFGVAHVGPSSSTCAHVTLSSWNASDCVLRARCGAPYSVAFLEMVFSPFFEPWTINRALRYHYPIFPWFYFVCIRLL